MSGAAHNPPASPVVLRIVLGQKVEEAAQLVINIVVPLIENHIIKVTERALDDFAGGEADEAMNRKILGL